MRFAALLVICGSLWMSGCASDTDESADATNSDPALADRSEETSPITSDTPSAGLASDPHTIPLSPENTTIQFVGTHVTEDGGPDPNARTGVFREFAGQAHVDPETNSLESVSVVIQTASLQTPQGGLNQHLATPDFFNVREYPTAKFESTKISPAADGEATHSITGNLTLLDATKEVTFPATIRLDGENWTLDSTFVLDRTEFGMDKLQDRVNKEVSMTIAVGKKTEPPMAEGGGRRGGRGMSRGRSFDPAEIFARQDADSDGKLAGDEISDRIRENLDTYDADGDGAVTLEEFQQGMRQVFGRRGGGDNGDAPADAEPAPDAE